MSKSGSNPHRCPIFFLASLLTPKKLTPRTHPLSSLSDFTCIKLAQIPSQHVSPYCRHPTDTFQDATLGCLFYTGSRQNRGQGAAIWCNVPEVTAGSVHEAAHLRISSCLGTRWGPPHSLASHRSVWNRTSLSGFHYFQAKEHGDCEAWCYSVGGKKSLLCVSAFLSNPNGKDQPWQGWRNMNWGQCCSISRRIRMSSFLGSKSSIHFIVWLHCNYSHNRIYISWYTNLISS